MVLYGISNCDTIRKAKKWLTERAIDFSFHDFRKDGLEAERLQTWIDALGWEPLLNKRGTTWRKISTEVEQDKLDSALAARLMLEHPALIKRPVLVMDGQIIVGFKPEQYGEIFS